MPLTPRVEKSSLKKISSPQFNNPNRIKHLLYSHTSTLKVKRKVQSLLLLINPLLCIRLIITRKVLRIIQIQRCQMDLYLLLKSFKILILRTQKRRIIFSRMNLMSKLCFYRHLIKIDMKLMGMERLNLWNMMEASNNFESIFSINF